MADQKETVSLDDIKKENVDLVRFFYFYFLYDSMIVICNTKCDFFYLLGNV